MTQHALVHLQNLRRGGNGILCAILRAGPRLSNRAVGGGGPRQAGRPCPAQQGEHGPEDTLGSVF